LADETTSTSYVAFAELAGPKLRDVLGAMFGREVGRDAAADALAYGWEHWERVEHMDNPVGYLFAVGRDRARQEFRTRRVVLAPVDAVRIPWVEPRLVGALEHLSERQRVVVMLVHCYEWSLSEVADVLGIAKGAVQSHERRGMRRLRRRLGVQS
jgi:RNA polymerase sigma factor (sigma-70 family)